MIEKEIIQLDPKAGSDYAQWAVSSVTTGSNCSFSEWEKERDQKSPTKPQQSFWMEKPKPGERHGPVGIVENEESIK